MKIYTVGVQIFHIPENPPPFLAELHDIPHITAGGVDMGVGYRLLRRGNQRGIGVIGGIVHINDLTAGFGNAVNNAGRGGNQIEIILPFQPLLDDFHM